MMSVPGLRLRAGWPDAERLEGLMHDKVSVEFHREVIDLRKQVEEVALDLEAEARSEGVGRKPS